MIILLTLMSMTALGLSMFALLVATGARELAQLALSEHDDTLDAAYGLFEDHEERLGDLEAQVNHIESSGQIDLFGLTDEEFDAFLRSHNLAALLREVEGG